MPCNEDYFLEEQSSLGDKANGATLSKYLKDFDTYMSPNSWETSVTSIWQKSQPFEDWYQRIQITADLELGNYHKISLQKYITSFNMYRYYFKSQAQTYFVDNSMTYFTEDENNLCDLQSFIESFNPYDELDD